VLPTTLAVRIDKYLDLGVPSTCRLSIEIEFTSCLRSRNASSVSSASATRRLSDRRQAHRLKEVITHRTLVGEVAGLRH
jgi:hypothetical protein